MTDQPINLTQLREQATAMKANGKPVRHPTVEAEALLALIDTAEAAHQALTVLDLTADYRAFHGHAQPVQELRALLDALARFTFTPPNQ